MNRTCIFFILFIYFFLIFFIFFEEKNLDYDAFIPSSLGEEGTKAYYGIQYKGNNIDYEKIYRLWHINHLKEYGKQKLAEIAKLGCVFPGISPENVFPMVFTLTAYLFKTVTCTKDIKAVLNLIRLRCKLSPMVLFELATLILFMLNMIRENGHNHSTSQFHIKNS